MQIIRPVSPARGTPAVSMRDTKGIIGAIVGVTGPLSVQGAGINAALMPCGRT